MENNNTPVKKYTIKHTKTSLAGLYGVSVSRFDDLFKEGQLKEIEAMKAKPTQRSYTPDMVRAVVRAIGNPLDFELVKTEDLK